MLQVITGKDPLVYEWISAYFPGFTVNAFESGVKATLGIFNDDKIVAGLVFTDYRGFEVEMTIAGNKAKWITKGVLSAIFNFVFYDLGCSRVKAKICKNNRRARKLAEGVGFKYEGKLRKGYDGIHDAILYGMLFRECRFLNKSMEEVSHG